MSNKSVKKKLLHSFIFRGKIKCKCGTNLSPEYQKQFIYYRCHKQSHICDFKIIREDVILKSLKMFFDCYKLSITEIKTIKKQLENSLGNLFDESEEKKKIINLAISKISKQEKNLISIRVNSLIDDDEFTAEREVLKNKKNNLQEAFSDDEMSDVYSIILKVFELLNNGFITWDAMTESNLLFLVDFVVSNFSITQKNALSIGVYSFLNFKKMLKSFDGG